MKVNKFKAWDIKRKKMYTSEEMGKDELTLSVDGRGLVNINSVSTKLSQYYTHLIPLQCIDINKDIYEDDVFRHNDDYIYKICYCVEKLAYCFFWWYAKEKKWLYAFTQPNVNEMVKIGNIHEMGGEFHEEKKGKSAMESTHS